MAQCSTPARGSPRAPLTSQSVCRERDPAEHSKHSANGRPRGWIMFLYIKKSERIEAYQLPKASCGHCRSGFVILVCFGTHIRKSVFICPYGQIGKVISLKRRSSPCSNQGKGTMLEDDAGGMVRRRALKTRFREIGWGSTPPSSAKLFGNGVMVTR